MPGSKPVIRSGKEFVVAVNVNEGQRVKKDDVLVEIDSRDYQNTLTQARGELTSIEARRRDAPAGVPHLSLESG